MELKKRHIAILGSTGSIGTQALQVIKGHPEFFQVEILTANENSDLLIRQAREFKPNAVVICNKDKYREVSDALDPEDIKVFAGQDALKQIVELDPVDIVLTATVGYSGLEPTLNAIRAGKTIALANKETLVVAGEMVMNLARKKGVEVLPVDSEHSAIFQCLLGEMSETVKKVILTASGGPFRERSREELNLVSVEEALDHPNWNMGDKITIDSATMMNKGLEMIEAKWLFGLSRESIDIIVHPQSVIHSLVEFNDGSLKAQLGIPDMKVPIQFALTYPYRMPLENENFDFSKYSTLNFEAPDPDRFPALKLAFHAMEKGGNIPCALNAANEIAVNAFLKGKIGFMEIPEVIEQVIHSVSFEKKPDFDVLESTDSQARKMTSEMVQKLNKVT